MTEHAQHTKSARKRRPSQAPILEIGDTAIVRIHLVGKSSKKGRTEKYVVVPCGQTDASATPKKLGAGAPIICGLFKQPVGIYHEVMLTGAYHRVWLRHIIKAPGISKP